MTTTLMMPMPAEPDQDRDRTRAAAESVDHDALAPGTRLDEFEIVRVLGAGGFGIVYLALDHVLLRYVAIKEYFPGALASRGESPTVRIRSAHQAETFALGLESFFNEARLLASFDHPSLVQVYRFWKAHGTAYMVMQYYPGQTLKEARRAMAQPPDEAWLRAFVEPILGALELLHGQDVYHRDIAPDNILLLPDGRPVLLDFGSARRVIGDRTQSLTAILKPNFAPLEQYADEPGMRQGPWTDLYSLGATVHFVLTGQVPVPAVMRAVRDALPCLATADAGSFPGVGAGFLATIDWTLALSPDRRPQNVAAMRSALGGEIEPPAPSPASPPSSPREPAPERLPQATTAPVPERATPSETLAPARPQLAPSAPTAAARPAAGRRTVAIAVGTLVLVILAAIGFSLPARNGAGSGGPATATAAPVVAVAAVAPPPASPPVSTTAAPVGTAAPSDALVPSSPAAPAQPASATVATARPAARSASANGEAGRAAPSAAARTKTVTLATAPNPVALRPTPPEAVPQVTAAAPMPARGPKESCGTLNFLAQAVCIDRECRNPQLQSHPQCIQARRFEEQRKSRMD